MNRDVRYHRVVPQDRNLAMLAQYYYGSADPKLALAIYQCNRDVIQSPNVITPGMVLAIPHIVPPPARVRLSL